MANQQKNIDDLGLLDEEGIPILMQSEEFFACCNQLCVGSKRKRFESLVREDDSDY